MPNRENITSPITIVGNGRSGTSLVSRILGGHSQCQFIGETANLIHSVARSMECSLPEKKHAEIPEVIRQQFVQLFASDDKRWVHKPIGVPIIAKMFPDEETFVDWYWETFEQIFPDAVYFTVLRHPLDIVLSSHQWWGDAFESIIDRNRLVAKLITHSKSRVAFAVNYHDLIARPKEEVQRLLSFVELDFEQSCLDAVDTGHVLNETSSGKSAGGDLLNTRLADSFSHRARWNEIDKTLITADYRDAVERCWNKFGFDFGGWSREDVA